MEKPVFQQALPAVRGDSGIADSEQEQSVLYMDDGRLQSMRLYEHVGMMFAFRPAAMPQTQEEEE